MNINSLRTLFLISNDPRDFNKPASPPGGECRGKFATLRQGIKGSPDALVTDLRVIVPYRTSKRKSLRDRWGEGGQLRVAENWFVPIDGKS